MPEIPFEWREEYDDEIFLKKVAAWIQFARAPKLSPREMAAIILDAGWTDQEAVKAMATAAGESDWRPHAINVDIHHGRADFGLWQINEIHKPDMSRIYDPAYNTKLAYGLYKHRLAQGKDGFSPWVAYKDGLLPYLEGRTEGFSPQKLKFWEKAWLTAQRAIGEEMVARQMKESGM